MKQNIQIIGIFIFAGVIFLPVAVLAQDAYDRVLEQGRQDCQKIANQVGEENPSVLANAVGSDDFFTTCGWDHFGYWRGYTSQIIEDIKIITNGIHFNRYNSEEAVKNDLKNIIAAYSENTVNADAVVSGLTTDTRKTADGFVSINKIDWVALSGDPAAAKDSDTSVIVGIARGNCLVSVSGDTMQELDAVKQYHYFDPKTYRYVDLHPDFNHDREAELLLLARAKAEEILSILDCGEGIPSTLPVEDLPEVEALVEKIPTNEDLPTPSKTEQSPENWGEAIVARMTGGADMQLADGSWQTVYVGTKIPFGAKLFSSYASEVTLEFPDHNLVIIVLALSEFDIDNPVDYIKNTPLLKIGSGDVRFKATQGDFRTDIKVSTPNSTASPTGTDFGVSYDKKTGRTVWEIYDHSIAVTSNNTGEIKTISSSYGAPIKRIEVAKDGVMVEQIAIPKDEWRARKAETASQVQSQENRGSGLFWIFVFLVLGGGIFWLYRTGKLQPILRKILALVQGDASKPL